MSAADIEKLQELALPVPVSYMPQTWGWLALLLVMCGALLAWAGLKYWRWRRNRYRREALSLLAQIALRLDDEHALRELPELLKRVALSMPDQPDVAALSGEPWQAFLSQRSGITLPADFSTQLAHLAYAPLDQLNAIPRERREQLLKLCTGWVESHHVAV